MLNGLIGQKLDQTQGFLEDGTRVPLSRISIAGNWITQIKNPEKDSYSSLQLGFGTKKKVTKAIAGHLKKAGKDTTPRFFREIRVDDIAGFELGQDVNPEEVFKPGDFVDVTGTSKGKGYAGGVKRYGFHGGPRTHGQSDRERAPGSIGQTTTPGRVYKGKRMAGNMGSDTVTLKNLTVMGIVDNILYIKGLIPGPRGSVVVIKKIGENKKFKPLFTAKTEEEVENGEELAATPVVEEVVEEIKEEVMPEEKASEPQAEAGESPVQEEKAEEASKADEATTQEEKVEENKETIEEKKEEENA